MRRIAKKFETLKSEGRKGLVTFIMAGDPDIDASLKILKSLPEKGADLIEIGVPFSDPAADGPVIQLAGQRALKQGTHIRQILDMVDAFRKDDADTPIILMGYANPIYSYGIDKFALDAANVGVDGLIVVDLPPEEDQLVREAVGNQFMDMIRLVSPTTQGDRLTKVIDGATGFLYYISITGITGGAKADLDSVDAHIKTIKKSTDLPVAIGFGIKTPKDAQEMSAFGDAVVVGSSIVEKIALLEEKAGKVKDDDPDLQTALTLVQSLSDALRA